MADAPKIKSDYAPLLNRLDEMQQAPYYATARDTLAEAERVICHLERLAARIDFIVSCANDAGANIVTMEQAWDWAMGQRMALEDRCKSEYLAGWLAAKKAAAKVCAEVDVDDYVKSKRSYGLDYANAIRSMPDPQEAE